LKGKYEPGKRRWWKLKRDYESNLVDSVDLVVLGAYYGTGNKGGKKSVFLMGCFNPASKRWQTVTKVGNGFDDAEIEHLQKEIDWQSVENELAPAWLDVQKPLVPDFIVPDPCQSPVWEIAGAGFTSSKTHTASGISIRFPRVIRKRADKSWKEATSLQDLRDRFSNAAKETVPTKRKKNS
jgi:DNA ligase-3